MTKKKNRDSTSKIKIRKEIFLGEIKLEDFLRREAELLLKKYKLALRTFVRYGIL
ncbi:hypothetical protein MLOOGBEN_06660 [Bacillus sp. EB106-08-02-XG196]|uniref:hypothetical protein n=1 Tax=Bacillus sp. EB106-08-02-XG196 TaxID=2737049 RepID=UPI0015C47D4C|nr:hypothetical protein [Bacillus sp. EB106-08-02-XG196]NWQ40379.1 hypothetical protein [Bacillus sp. EB106-08-02-XG196]